MEKYNVDDVLKFLSDWKSGQQVKKKFGITQNEAYHLFRWLRKGNFVHKCNGKALINEMTNVDCRVYFYKVKKN